MTVQRTGGLAGVDDTVVVSGSGAWTATRRGGASTSGQLPPGRLSGLRLLVGGTAWQAEGARAPDRPCAAGFGYVVTAGGRTARTNDCALATQPALSVLTRSVLAAAGL